METFYSLDKALLSFSLTEHKNFNKFIHSPYVINPHSDNNIIQKIYKEIKSYFIIPKRYKQFNWNSSICKVCGRYVSSKKTSKIKSELLNYILQFMTFEKFRKETFHNKLYLLSELQNRGLNELMEHVQNCSRFKKQFNFCNEEWNIDKYRVLKLLNKHRELNGYSNNSNYIVGYDFLTKFMQREKEEILSKISIDGLYQQENYTDLNRQQALKTKGNTPAF